MDVKAAQIISQLGASPLLVVLRALQKEEGCITEASLTALARDRRMSLSKLYGIVTSYPEFRLERGMEEKRPAAEPQDLPGFMAAMAQKDVSRVLQPGPLTERFASAPATLAEYEDSGGLKALKAASGMEPRQILAEVVLGGLTGKPREWEAASSMATEPVIIVNCHEGDPFSRQGAALIENDPYQVLEGAFIAAIGTGARRGFLFIGPREDRLSNRLTKAAEEIQRAANINFVVDIVTGPESLVGSEDTVAAAVIGDCRPVPAANPASIAARGVWGKPTLVDSAECFASLAATLSSGRPVASRIYQVSWGSKKGLVEAEPGMTIRHLLKTAGFPPGPVLGGGLAGAFLTEGELDLPLNSLQRSDSPRWRTVHLFGDDADFFDIATKITAYNSCYLCGYCIPCRIGMVRMAEIMASSPVDKELLEEVAITVEKTGLCAPGRGAAKLVMSVI